MIYIHFGAGAGRRPVLWAFGWQGGQTELITSRTMTMTIEIIQLTAQIQQWLNHRVARHLAAQAAKFSRGQDADHHTVNA
jgi:hypothetical protein